MTIRSSTPPSRYFENAADQLEALRPGEWEVEAGVYCFARDCSVPPGVTLRLNRGAIFKPAAGVTVTFGDRTRLFATHEWKDLSEVNAAIVFGSDAFVEAVVPFSGAASNGPNVVRGFGGNAIAQDVGGATIAGGGSEGRENIVGGTDMSTVNTGTPNQVGEGSGADLSVITGGYDNIAGGLASIVNGFHNYTTPESTHGTIGGGSVQKIDAGDYNTIAGGTGNGINTPGGGRSTIGGGAGNEISGVISGATIAGGQNNDATGRRSVVGGGESNLASGNKSTVAGGELNQASAENATVGGGNLNIASGAHATVAGGADNQATQPRATVSGGEDNRATGNASTVGGGANNQATGANSSVLGGSDNVASGSGAVVFGGVGNTASGARAAVLGGDALTAAGDYSTISGFRASTALFGERAHAAGYFAAVGDAEERRFVVRRVTTDANPLELRTDGSSGQLVMPDNTTWAFRALLVGRRTDAAGGHAAYELRGILSRGVGAASVALVGSVTKTVIAEVDAAWDVNAGGSVTAGGLTITATGEAGKTVRWVAIVEVVQVSS